MVFLFRFSEGGNGVLIEAPTLSQAKEKFENRPDIEKKYVQIDGCMISGGAEIAYDMEEYWAYYQENDIEYIPVEELCDLEIPY